MTEKIRVVCMSDTHLIHEVGSSIHPVPPVPDGDILIHAGDFTHMGTHDEMHRAMRWFGSLPHKHKVMIAGNHDWIFERRPGVGRKLVPSNVIYLESSEVEVMGLRIYGSPFQPAFLEWAFNLPRGPRLRDEWARIPDKVDVLVTHGPPFGILDQTPSGEKVGCTDLLDRVLKVEPKLHVFGHIHHRGGELRKIGKTTFVNAAILNEAYQYGHEPVVVDIDL